MAVVEDFIRGSDNQIKLQLTEDDDPILGAWSGLDIHIGDVVLTRTASQDGIVLSEATGVLTINPADLDPAELTALEALRAGVSYKVKIVLTSVLNDDGVVFGGAGSTRIYFNIVDKP